MPDAFLEKLLDILQMTVHDPHIVINMLDVDGDYHGGNVAKRP